MRWRTRQPHCVQLAFSFPHLRSGVFEIAEASGVRTGTKIILHLRPDSKEFASEARVRGELEPGRLGGVQWLGRRSGWLPVLAGSMRPWEAGPAGAVGWVLSYTLGGCMRCFPRRPPAPGPGL